MPQTWGKKIKEILLWPFISAADIASHNHFVIFDHVFASNTGTIFATGKIPQIYWC
jgi:hypothetical protein